MTNYIYLLYGTGDECYTEAAYCIGTLRRRVAAASARIIVYTDAPEKVKDWPVVTESVAGQLAAMRGKTDFSHRAKLCVILKCFEKYPGNVIFLDSDTFVREDIGKLARRLSSGTAIMHLFESENPEIGVAGFQTLLAGKISYRFTSAAQMHNSGVIGLHRDNREVVSLALELCDAILDFGRRLHTAEQFSIGEALRISNVKILEARSAVTHYVQNKFYMRGKIYEMIRQTGRPPWQFENLISYSCRKLYWLQKLGFITE